MRVKSKPVVQSFILRTDPEKKAEIKIKQLSAGAALQLEDLRSRSELYEVWKTEDGSEVNYRRGTPTVELRLRFLALALAGATGFNISENEDQVVEMFRFKTQDGVEMVDMTYEDFNKAVSQLPKEVFDEMVEYALAINPGFGYLTGE